ncbi:Vps5 C terminal like-domain-containing protein [Chlamydoabsidia padenii]|nr:Vps5 C terminal like-domain-containing protein [Chlamydoabsidia padenii]
MARLFLSVPEAAASSDTIQFKLVLTGPGLQDFITQHNVIQTTVFRSFQQIAWLHEQLCKTVKVVVPTLPESPALSLMDDQDYVERKRLQIGRYFDKVIHRKVFYAHEQFIYFLSNDMSPTQVGLTSKGVLSFLRFNRTLKQGRGGFHSYKATEPVEGDENDTFHRHQIYILMLESYFGSIAEALSQMILLREGLADTLTHLGDMVIETTQSKYRLGDGITQKDQQRALDRKMQLFGLLMDELGFLVTRQGKEENMQYGDVLLEYKNSMDGLKTVFNARTQKLMEYVTSAKQRNRKRDRADKLKLRMGLNASEVRLAMTEEQEATDELGETKRQFDECQDTVKNEIRLFETQKRRDLTHSMRNYANLSLHYERAKLKALEKTLSEIQLLKPTPIAYHHPLNLLDDEDTQSSSSGNSSHRERNTTTSGGSNNSSKRRHKNHHRPQKTLQSSASLPTWTRKRIDDGGNDDDGNTSDKNGIDDNNTGDDTFITRRVSPFTRYEDGTSSHALSASYDDRLRNSTTTSW